MIDFDQKKRPSADSIIEKYFGKNTIYSTITREADRISTLDNYSSPNIYRASHTSRHGN